MSAETLREAARLMRERAEAAEEGPWVSYHDPNRPDEAVVAIRDDSDIAYCPDCGTRAEYQDADARHIASWHPAVALAVADWLDATAVTMQQVTDDLRGLEGAPTVEQVYGYDFTAALAVARAYLGEAS